MESRPFTTEHKNTSSSSEENQNVEVMATRVTRRWT